MPVKVNILELGEAWKQHARMVPVGFTPLGTVNRGGKVHAFARDAMGNYWVFGDGRPEPLPAIRVQKGIAALSIRAKPDAILAGFDQ